MLYAIAKENKKNKENKNKNKNKKKGKVGNRRQKAL
jgi:hypothetical protein